MATRSSESLDAAGVKEEQRTTWNEMSANWYSVRQDFERGAGTVTTRLLELAGLREGQVVLDVATGPGEPALSVARIVGDTGKVVGIDISPGMIEIARRRAAELTNVEFIEADLESVELPADHFDVALSRFGLMFAIDHVATFRALIRLLAPGGVLAAAVWGPPAKHLMTTGPAALGDRLELPTPAPGTPGPFSMSDARQLADELTEAGFTDVAVVERTVPFRFESVDDYVQFNKRALPPSMVRTARGRLSDDEIDTIMADAVAGLVADDGSLPLPSAALLLRAVAPA